MTLQSVYVYYSGNGSERYFTAPSDEQATEFVKKNVELTEYSSAFPTSVLIQATGTYWLRYGIPVQSSKNLIPKPVKK